MLLLTFSGTAVLLGLGGLCLLVSLTIFGLRRFISAPRAGASGKRTKNAAFSFTAPLHRLSLCVAIAASLIAINYTNFAPVQVLEGYTVTDIDDLDVVGPREGGKGGDPAARRGPTTGSPLPRCHRRPPSLSRCGNRK